jgi:hypothetical protein
MDESITAARPLFVPTQTTGVAVRTVDQLVIGLFHAAPQKRLKDELNVISDNYLAITAARVYDAAGSRLLYESAVILLASAHIVSITPLAAVRHGEAAWSTLLTAPAERH